MKTVDLIPLHVRRRRAQRNCLRRWGVALSVHLMLVLAACAGVKGALGAGRRNLTGDLAAATSRAARMEQEINAVRRELTELETRRAAAQSIAEHPNWSHLLAILADVLEDEVILRSVTLSPASGSAAAPGTAAPAVPGVIAQFTVSIRASGRAQTSVSAFILRLQQLCIFDEVRLVRSGLEGSSDGTAVAFEIECPISR